MFDYAWKHTTDIALRNVRTNNIKYTILADRMTWPKYTMSKNFLNTNLYRYIEAVILTSLSRHLQISHCGIPAGI